MHDQVWAHFTSGILSHGNQRGWREEMDRGFYCLAAVSNLGWLKIFMT